jgi:ABC-type lipoprotein release transport system permease subunit
VRDVSSWAFVILALLATTLAASWRPAQQAMRADPAQLLRED